MESSDPVLLVTTTAGSREEAEEISQRCVSERLAACAQLSGPLTSIYWWKGMMHSESEWKVTLKSFKSLERRLFTRICELHPYEVPEIICVMAETVSDAYLEWMDSNLRET